jgi:hypothetical protein
MGRWAAVAVILLAGCTPSPVLSIGDRAGLGAHLAYLAATATTPAPTPPPAPAPAPSPAGEACNECGGTGRVGDGTVSLPCGACGGTGRRPAAPPAPPAPPAKPALGPPPGPGTWRKVCGPDGCRWERMP